MSNKHIDISISFNDVIPPDGICFVNKPISFYDQLLILIKSIILNWDKTKYDYTIYVHYSRFLSIERKDELEKIGCVLCFNSNEIQEYYNRENIYGFKTNGDYTLILDTDMIVINTPTLEFNYDMYMKPTDFNLLEEEEWGHLYELMNIKNIRTQPEDSIYNYHHFNNGCIFINNKNKADIYNYMMSDSYLKHKLPIIVEYSRHYSPQIAYSLLLKKLNSGILNPRLNVFSKNINNDEDLKDVDILHYLGINGYNDIIISLIKKINDRWQKEYIK